MSERRHIRLVAIRAAAMVIASFLAIFVVQAIAAAPEVAEIVEPSAGGAPLNPADVHMVAEYFDEDGDEHLESDWEIRTVAPGTAEVVWEAREAVGESTVHIHLGDGDFVNSYAGRTELKHETAYVLRVRFRDDSGNEEEEWSEWSERPFSTRTAGAEGAEAKVPWKAREGYTVEPVASGFRLPVNIAMVPEPGPHPGDPLFYVAELYGDIKVVSRDGTVRDYANDLLNYDPNGVFPGSGEQGLAGIVVEPESGDLFASLIHEGPAPDREHYPQVIRLESDDHGLAAMGQTTILDMVGEVQGPSHQVSNLTISPDGNLFVHNGEGILAPDTAQDLDRFRGKILAMTLAGEPLESNPFYEAGDGISAKDYVYAYGFRNPFGGVWRLSDGTHWEVENGPFVDRLARIESGVNYGWPSDFDLSDHAVYNWDPPHAPVNIDFVEPARQGGSGFPAEAMGHAFVTESGSTWATGPQEFGKRIVEFDLGEEDLRSGPDLLAEYTGVGKATAVGLAAGPDGLYFTDLYKDTGYSSPIDAGANVLRVRYCADHCPVEPVDEPAAAPIDRKRPVVRRFRVRRKVFAVRGTRYRRHRRHVRRPGSRRRAGASAAARYGTRFVYSLSERSRAWIRIRRVRARGPRGKVVRTAGPRGTIRTSGRRGFNRRRFAGRLKRRPLPPGRYRATIRARDRAGNLSRPRRVVFRVARGR